jgi:hypothetical protein
MDSRKKAAALVAATLGSNSLFLPKDTAAEDL